MGDITWSDVTNHFSTLTTSAVPVAAQTDILAFVNDEALSALVFGGEDSARYKLARIYLAAHMGEIEARNARSGGAVGPVDSKTITAESLSVRYANVVSDLDALSTTPGGSSLRSLIRRTPRARLFARSCS